MRKKTYKNNLIFNLIIMKIILQENKHQVFNHISQKEKKIYKMRCSIFAPVINLYYNTWIKLTYEDIEKIAEKQKAKWKLSDKNGWYGYDNAVAVSDYVGRNLITFDNKDPLYFKLLNSWYMVTLWIWVTKEFTNDIKPDWDLDLYSDYQKYKWNDLKHFLNIIRKQEEEFLVDNYFFYTWENLWKVQSEEMLKVAYPTMYAFI